MTRTLFPLPNPLSAWPAGRVPLRNQPLRRLAAAVWLAAVASPALAASQSVGVYNPTTGMFGLRSTPSAGTVDFDLRMTGPGKWPLIGDWDKDGVDSIGLYRPTSRRFLLRNQNSAGKAELTFQLRGVRTGLIPVAGDWDGDGTDSVGVYDPATRTFHLKQANATGPADLSVSFEGAGRTWRPVAGDWDGDGTDSVGLYDPKTGTFHLRNDAGTNTPEILARIEFDGDTRSWLPVVGDWDGNTTTTLGLYHPATRTFRLRNANSDGPADLEFQLQKVRKGSLPLAGTWGSIPLASPAQACVDAINGYRATLSLKALTRWTEAEACANAQSKSDSASGQPHGAFGDCQEWAQNECPDWPGPAESMIGGCLQMMWDEGPGSDFPTHGHYINMSNPNYTQVACGFYTKPDGRVWSVQDFR